MTNEKSELIEQILAHQGELEIPVETKRLRILRMIITSVVIVIALRLFRPLGVHAPPIVNLLIEAVIGVGVASLIARVWIYVRMVFG